MIGWKTTVFCTECALDNVILVDTMAITSCSVICCPTIGPDLTVWTVKAKLLGCGNEIILPDGPHLKFDLKVFSVNMV